MRVLILFMVTTPNKALQLKEPTDLAASDGSHVVQYYEEPSFLVRRVSEFIALGLEAGEAALVIATREHHLLITDDLVQRGIDVAGARRSGSYVVLDAKEALSRFMRDGRPDRASFIELVGGAIAQARPRARYPIVRAFGEMVAVLWAAGQRDAALELEELWNELIGHHPFSLMCGYPTDIFGPEDTAALEKVSAAHGRVLRGEDEAAAD
ncbi:MAG: MEDS domain-containing protein [Candidatus Limnocylindria bacterium]